MRYTLNKDFFMLKRLYITFLIITPTPLAFAIESDFKQPIYFQSDSALLNTNQNTFKASGVQISQGTILIQASSASGSLRNGQPYQVTLTGNPVKFQQKLSSEKGMVYGKANSINYSSTSTEIVLKGNASITQDDGTSLSGETLRYNLTMGDIEAKGSSNKRLQMIIPPQKNVNKKLLDTAQ